MEQLRYLLGIATLLGVCVAGWFIFQLLTADDLAGRFHVIVRFHDAHGMRVGADVRYRGVRVGEVIGIEVGGGGDEGDRVAVSLVLDPPHVPAQNTRFWIVAPRYEGLTAGASGLDTLVRDPYVAVLTPEPAGPPLGPNSVVAGQERPFVDPAEAALEPERHGDLRMTLHTRESHGLHVGHDVRFRGLIVGDVRSIDLAPSGHHVIVGLRIEQRYRHTVTDASVFWVARPRLSGALISGIAIEDINAILTPFVGYRSEPDHGVPVADGYRAVASDARPATDDATIELAAAAAPTSGNGAGEPDGIQLVEITYEAIERDWWTPNDRVSRRSTGVLYIDQAGRYVVVTTRTACDANYFVRDVLSGAPDITSESWSVSIPGGVVVRAGRSWVDAGDIDLALLVLEEPPLSLPFTDPTRFAWEAPSEGDALEARPWDEPGTRLDPAALPESLEELRGAVVLGAEGRIVGLLGRRGSADKTTAIVPIGALPAELRPGQ